MNVPEIRGPGNLHPGREGKARKAREDALSPERPVDFSDKVSISREFSRQAMEVDRLVEKARGEEPERVEALAEVKERLESGALDRQEVFRRTAEKILYGG